MTTDAELFSMIELPWRKPKSDKLPASKTFRGELHGSSLVGNIYEFKKGEFCVIYVENGKPLAVSTRTFKKEDLVKIGSTRYTANSITHKFKISA